MIARQLLIVPILSFSVAILTDSSCNERSKSKPLTIEERVYIPMAACDNGEPVPNMAVPIHGGAQFVCPSSPKKTSLRSKPVISADGIAMEVGTVVVMSISREQAILATDSRRTNIDLKNRRINGYHDSACKLQALSPSLLFAAAGMTSTDRSLPADIYYDAVELGRQASQTFEFDPTWMEQNQAVREIAAMWAWDVAFHIRRGLREGLYRPFHSTWVTGVFVGLEPNGELSAAIATLEYHEQRAGMIVPPISILIRNPIPPKNFTWIDSFGRNDVTESYVSKQRVTDETRALHLRFRNQQVSNPRHFSAQIVKELVELTIEKDEVRLSDGNSYKPVGGEVDIARLRRKGVVEWVQRKDGCAQVIASP